jgi:anti-sigma B factor antagonist
VQGSLIASDWIVGIRKLSANPAIQPDRDAVTMKKDWMRENASPATPVPHQRHPNVLPLEGDIDLHVSPVVSESLSAIIKKKPERIVIDLSRATYIDSAGMAALMQAMQEVEAYGGQFFLSGLQETIRSIFEISRLDRTFRIFPDVDTALAASQSSAIPARS